MGEIYQQKATRKPPERAAIAAALLLSLAACATTDLDSSRPHCDGPPAARDAYGNILRSPTAKARFKTVHPCPATGNSTGPCPGWVVDHIVALKRGGPDLPCNMQWQSVEEARYKDLIE